LYSWLDHISYTLLNTLCRWVSLNTTTLKFSGIYNRIERNPPSGTVDISRGLACSSKNCISPADRRSHL
jgi:hypothetical protein